MNDLESLYDSLIGNDYQARKEHYIKKLTLIANNLSDSHPLKSSLEQYIELFCEKDIIKIDMSYFQKISQKLRKAGLLPDDSSQELLKAISFQTHHTEVQGQVIDFSTKVTKIIPND